MSIDQSSASRNYLLNPAAMAGAVAAGAAFWRPGATVIIPGGQAMPLPLVAAGATFLAAEAAALINTYLFPHIPVINAVSAPAHTALNIGVVVAGTAAVENFMSPGLVGDLGLTELVAFGALSEVSSTYLVDEWVIPMMQKWGY